MALLFSERVRETFTTTGTGDITLAGAVTGFVTFSSVFATGSFCNYALVGVTEWEVGIGLLSASTTLERYSITASSNAGALVNFSAGTKQAFVSPLAHNFEALDNFFFGDGSDGNVTVSSSIALTTDMNYNNLTLAAGCSIDTNGYKIFVNGVLYADNAPLNAIHNNGANGGNSSSATGGSAGTFQTANTVGGGGNGTAGGNSTTTDGAQASAVGAQNPSNGGSGGQGGAGGTGASGSGGALRAGGVASNPTSFKRYDPVMYRQLQIQGGAAGAGGGGGGGDGTAGGGGGGGAGAAGGIWISARFVSRGASTVAGAIIARGGAGGNGFAPAAGNRGGGGGGGGGAGGFIVLYYGYLLGTTATNMLQSIGGTGGNGANATGTGLGGDGGSGGNSGQINAICLYSATKVQTNGATGTAGTLNSGATGGAGGAGATTQYSL